MHLYQEGTVEGVQEHYFKLLPYKLGENNICDKGCGYVFEGNWPSLENVEMSIDKLIQDIAELGKSALGKLGKRSASI